MKTHSEASWEGQPLDVLLVAVFSLCRKMCDLPWHSFAILLLACLLIQVNSKPSNLANKYGKQSKSKNVYGQSGSERGKAPEKAKWDSKKGPKKSSAISSEKIPLPTFKDKQKYQRQMASSRNHISHSQRNHLMHSRSQKNFKENKFFDVPMSVYDEEKDKMAIKQQIDLVDQEMAVDDDDLNTKIDKTRANIKNFKKATTKQSYKPLDVDHYIEKPRQLSEHFEPEEFEIAEEDTDFIKEPDVSSKLSDFGNLWDTEEIENSDNFQIINEKRHGQRISRNNKAVGRLKLGSKKGPHKSSAISSENIPLPTAKDKKKYERQMARSGNHISHSNRNHLIHPRSKKYIKEDPSADVSGSVYVDARILQQSEEIENESRNSENNELINDDRGFQKMRHLHGEVAMDKTRSLYHERSRDRKTLQKNMQTTNTRPLHNIQNSDDVIVEPPAPVARKLNDGLQMTKPLMESTKTPEEREAEEEYIFQRWVEAQNTDDAETSDLDKRAARPKSRAGSKKKKIKLPKIFGLDLDKLGKEHPHKFMRNGSATFTDSCHSVRRIESWMRQDETLYVGINPFYVKFTEAYGIFIIGSSNVTDNGLQRACYSLKIMLSSRYDIRNAYYKFFGRIALIGDGEEQTSLFEYSQWSSKYWDRRARGLGPTITIPMTSAGDDNMRCKSGDRYFDQDIFVHEMGHAVHLLGASYVVPGFQKKLKKLYQKTVKELGKWNDTYAATNLNEYVGVATQFFMNAFRGTSYMKFGVTDRDSLAAYDPGIHALLQELYPCIGTQNRLIHRCSWKYCSLSNFVLQFKGSVYRTSSNCPQLKSNNKKMTAQECAQYTCYYRGNAFAFDAPTCIVLNCPNTTKSGLMIDQGRHSFDIYTGLNIPRMTLKSELKQQVTQLCVKGSLMPDKCKNVPMADRSSCGDLAKRACQDVGCCYDKSKKFCYYPKQDCVDKFLDCYQYAEKGDCERNPVMMYQKCPFACDVCQQLSKLQSDSWKDWCQDRTLYCEDWASKGECQRNPSYMERNCALSCTNCKVVDPFKQTYYG